MFLFLAALEQALLLLPLVLGMYLSYRVLNVTDLTVDGTYVLGAAVFARFIHLGVFPALLLSILAGLIVGNIVGYMQRDGKVGDLVVGILASFMLYSVNLQVMGRPNISVLGQPTIASIFGLETWSILLVIIACLLMIGLVILLRSRMGLFLRAFGHNQKLLLVLGKPAERYRLLGLAISNALAAFTGAIYTQLNGFADINMGFGVALVSIGAVVIGRHIIVRSQENFNAIREILSCLVGIFLYFMLLNGLLYMGINPANLKFVLGIVLFLSLRNVRRV